MVGGGTSQCGVIVDVYITLHLAEPRCLSIAVVHYYTTFLCSITQFSKIYEKRLNNINFRYVIQCSVCIYVRTYVYTVNTR